MDHTIEGYRVLPCCQYEHTEDFHSVKDPADIHNHFFIENIKKDFANGIKHKGCNLCWENERLGIPSKRLDTEKGVVFQGKYQNWDLRPSNICNLKCTMCQPQCSTKWYEDIDIFYKHRGGIDIIETIRNKGEFDWDFVKKHAPNNAYKIYIAGGEPLYDKKVYNFVEYLSEFEWNRKNTRLLFNTNGVSYTGKWKKVLNKFFTKPSFITSVDGIGDIDNYIRFPSNYQEKLIQAKKLKKQNFDIFYNLTISALNFPNAMQVIRKFNPGLNTLVHPNFLHINSLKPDVIYGVKKVKNKPAYVADLIKNYSYNEDGNKKLKAYLQDLDNKRNTDSKRVLPWCWA
jgi:hypothetical protein